MAEARNIIVKIQGDIDNWVLNNGVIKDYIEWLDVALIRLEYPDDIFHSEIKPCCCIYGPAICWFYTH